MEQNNILEQIAKLEQEMNALPAGSISTKKVNGREYYYHRQMVGGKRVEKYVPAEDVEALRAQIKQRRELQSKLKSLQKTVPITKAPVKTATEEHSFITNVRVGNSLRMFSAPVKKFAKRSCYQSLDSYIHGDTQDKVFILYGLRRTGKTTLIRQAINDMSDKELYQTAFIQINTKNTLADVNHDLKYLEAHGYRTVFLDEVTLMVDFIQGAALFSDVFATCGMRIILSGTDSLGFLFTEDEQLYDRCIMLHTTFIPYREFESILGIHGIDEYIRYGGTMSLGGVHYNEASTFATKEKADAYVDTAIARNIQHSLRCYQYEGHFRNLQDLYEKNELTSAINRVVEDINHRFTLEVLTQDFQSHDFASSARNLRNDRNSPTDILDRVDLPTVTEKLKQLLEIRDRSDQSVTISADAISEIQEYLHLLDLIQDIDIVSMTNLNRRKTRTVIAQSGLRYAQADALVTSLLADETFANLSLPERNAICARIRSEIQGRMMEDIILLETKLSNPKKEVFVLQFAIGEFDMVVFDPKEANCQIYEIKHSTETVPQQYRHLVNEEKCAQTEHRYGTITAKTVLYRGKSQDVNGICYQNVEEYLRGLSD